MSGRGPSVPRDDPRGHDPFDDGIGPDVVGYDTVWTEPDTADDFDTAFEVEAAFRTQRRVALAHALVFLLVVLGAPVLNLVLDWWTRARLLGGMSPGFALVAIGLYVGFFVLALAAASLANGVEDAMLGTIGGDDASPESGP